MRPLILLATFAVTPAAAQVRAVPDQPASRAAASDGVDVFLFNESVNSVPVDAPATLQVTAADGTPLSLRRDGPIVGTIGPGGFAKVRYQLVEAIASARAASPARPELAIATGNGVASGFADRFQPYEPIYGVAGAGDSGAKLQVSFAFRPFDRGLLEHFRFTYTQTMFWAIDLPSGPFRSTNYAPEALLDLPVDASTRVAVGYRHDSNGRGEIGSIDVNRLFVRAAKTFSLGGRWQAELAPQAWIYVGQQGIAPDLDRYWGFTSLKASVFEAEGLKLSVTARGNPGTGRGAAELYASYPLARPLGVGVYLFGQGFTGYGEALDDYRVSDTHLRLGIALTR